MANTADIPDWLQWGAAAVGVVIATIAGRMGWKATTAATSSPVELAGGIIDNRSSKEIVETLRKVSEDYQDAQERYLEALRVNSDEIRRLHQEIRELAREIAVHSR